MRRTGVAPVRIDRVLGVPPLIARVRIPGPRSALHGLPFVVRQVPVVMIVRLRVLDFRKVVMRDRVETFPRVIHVLLL